MAVSSLSVSRFELTISIAERDTAGDPRLSLEERYGSRDAYVARLKAQYEQEIIAKLVENQATEDDLAPIHLASFPKNLSPEMREAAVSHIARQFSPDRETPAPAAPVHASGATSNDGGNHEHHS